LKHGKISEGFQAKTTVKAQLAGTETEREGTGEPKPRQVAATPGNGRGYERKAPRSMLSSGRIAARQHAECAIRKFGGGVRRVPCQKRQWTGGAEHYFVINQLGFVARA
jgi:hypothetical protein